MPQKLLLWDLKRLSTPRVTKSAFLTPKMYNLKGTILVIYHCVNGYWDVPHLLHIEQWWDLAGLIWMPKISSKSQQIKTDGYMKMYIHVNSGVLQAILYITWLNKYEHLHEFLCLIYHIWRGTNISKNAWKNSNIHHLYFATGILST